MFNDLSLVSPKRGIGYPKKRKRKREKRWHAPEA